MRSLRKQLKDEEEPDSEDNQKRELPRIGDLAECKGRHSLKGALHNLPPGPLTFLIQNLPPSHSNLHTNTLPQ